MLESATTLISVLASAVTILSGLVVWGVRQFISGNIVHKSTVADVSKSWKELYEEKKNEASGWKKNYEEEHATHLLAIQQNIKLLEVAHTADRVLNALPSVEKPSVGEG